MSTQDHYETLQVSRRAEPEVIEKAYKALSMKYHPDRVPPEKRPLATRRMQRINAAYAVLSDPKLRARYDETVPSRGEYAWDEFLEKGLVGLFADWVRGRV